MQSRYWPTAQSSLENTARSGRFDTFRSIEETDEEFKGKQKSLFRRSKAAYIDDDDDTIKKASVHERLYDTHRQLLTG